MVWWLEIPRISYCRALLADGTQISLEEAATSLDEILQQNEANHNICQMIQIMPLLALVHKKLDKLGEALETLGQAVALAEKGGWIRPFVELGEPMQGLLLQLQKENAASVFVDQLVA
jgi:LuxR family maltose regulon positive regulatory protein